MRIIHWIILGFVIVFGVSVYWAHKVDLVYGVWGQYQKTPDEKFRERQYRVFSAMALEWDGECLLEPVPATYTEKEKLHRSNAKFGAWGIGNVKALYCAANSYAEYKDLPYKLHRVYEILTLAELIAGTLPPAKQIQKENAAAAINTIEQDDGYYLKFMQGEVERKYHRLLDAGVLDPNNAMSWPEPFKAFNTALTQKMQVTDKKKLARNWNGLCIDNPLQTRHRKWKDLRRIAQYEAARKIGNVAALYCSIDFDIADTTQILNTQALEKLLLVKILLGALPPKRQKMLDELQAKYTQSELEITKIFVEDLYNQLVVYGAIEAKPNP